VEHRKNPFDMHRGWLSGMETRPTVLGIFNGNTVLGNLQRRHK